MAIFKCKMCGGDLQISDADKVIECEYCGTNQTVPSADNEKKLNLFNRANRLRINGEFDKATAIYESIVAEFPEEAEAYWGLVICNYGIEYVDDPATAKKIPTCHRASFESIQKDENYELALEYADVVAQKIYRDEAREIDRIREEILAVSKNEQPYDIFICYKETADNGERTIDSVIAQDLYDTLTDKGYRVFFARISLEDKLGRQYEPYIFAALNSAKVMLSFGTKYEYFHAVWVKNEWSRFLKLMATDKSKALIPCYKDMDAYDLPDEFKALQAQDMGKVGAIQDLLRGIEKIIPREPAKTENVVVQQSTNNHTIDSLLKRAFMFLEDGDWASANEYCEKVLDIDPENASAYLGKLMAELKISKQSALSKQNKSFEDNANYQKAVRFADDDLKNVLKHYVATVAEVIKESQNESAIIQKKLKYAQNLICGGDCVYAIKKDGTVLSTLKTDYRVSQWLNIIAIASGYSYVIGLRGDGTVVARGEKDDGQCNVESWTDIIAISTGGYHTIGLKKDGTVVATGKNDEGQCDVESWTDIVAISAGRYHTVGLKKDGTVVATGKNDEGQCDVESWSDISAVAAGASQTIGLKNNGTIVLSPNRHSDIFSKWIDIVAISTVDSGFFALKKDGTVRVSGFHTSSSYLNASEWTDIIAINTGVGLKKDGTMVSTDRSSNKEIKDWKLFDDFDNLEQESLVARQQKMIEYTKHCDELKTIREKIRPVQNLLGLGQYHIAGIKCDGTVVATGLNDNGQCNVHNWTDIVSVASGMFHTVGLKNDGTVVATGQNYYGTCNVQSWTGIIAVYACSSCTFGLKNDGTVVATGENGDGQRNVESWTDIIKISSRAIGYTIGVKKDGTVVATGKNECCRCNVDSWSDIVDISALLYHTVGLKKDGTVVATGNDKYGQDNVESWTDIVAISVGAYHTVGLKKDGTVVATGKNDEGQCNVESWSDIVAISVGAYHTVGLKKDGTVVATGLDTSRQCWDSQWFTDVVAISTSNFHTAALKKDGTVDVIGKNDKEQSIERHSINQNWKLFCDFENIEKERNDARQKRELQKTLIAERKAKNVCLFCGGEFRGLFTKKCVKCGKTKDY